MKSQVLISILLLGLSFSPNALAGRQQDCENWLVRTEGDGAMSFIIGAKPVLKTKRLILRAFRPGEDSIEDVAAMVRDPDIGHQMKEMAKSRSQQKIILEITDMLSKGVQEPVFTDHWYTRLDLGIFEKTSNKLIGVLALIEHDNTEISFGYMIQSAYRGNAYAPEAAKEAIRAISAAMGPRAFFAYTTPDNKASLRTFEKLGLEYWLTQDGYVYYSYER